jgi:alkanesulfonate monooxygenase SsuD/methylene tetrahydromethanopterin reductase-like flavin-dependent oxidoreductase (luciferase family)
MVYTSVSFVGFTGPFSDLLELVHTLESNQLDLVSLPDDLWIRDVFTALAIFAVKTKHIGLGFITNPYSRHPVLIARATASLQELAPSRIRVGLCAGGSFTLLPLGIPMWKKPVSRVRETIQICQQLLKGETVSFTGQHFILKDVKLQFSFPHILPKFFVAGRGPNILSLAAELGDGATITPISANYEKMIKSRIHETAIRFHRDPKEIMMETGVTLTSKPTDEFAQFAARRVANVIHDTPKSILETFQSQVTPEIMDIIYQIHDASSVDVAVPLITSDLGFLYRDLVNSPKALLDMMKQKVQEGYQAVNIVIPPGEEKAVVDMLNNEIITKLHALST